jgi:hypothetical protein
MLTNQIILLKKIQYVEKNKITNTIYKRVNLFFKSGGKMPDENVSSKDNENNFEILKTLYTTNQSEITRYRDREWAVPSIFIAAMIAVIKYFITDYQNISSYYIYVEFLQFSLAFCNTYYLIFTHTRLTQARKIRQMIEEMFKSESYSTSEIKKLLKYKNNQIKIHKNIDLFFEGFWSHILPFIVACWIILYFGLRIEIDLLYK